MQALRRGGTSLLLFAVYLLLIMPAGLMVRLVRDPLHRSPDRAAGSYWIDIGAGGNFRGERRAQAQ